MVRVCVCVWGEGVCAWGGRGRWYVFVYVSVCGGWNVCMSVGGVGGWGGGCEEGRMGDMCVCGGSKGGGGRACVCVYVCICARVYVGM